MMRSNRIRSTYQRRVLDWLADGGGTVTEVSQALSIRVPHASAALKQLRESGDVVRDDASLRGSRYRLSSQGLNRLEGDGLARLKELVRWPPPPGAAGVVLAREGSMLLLGYASQPAGPLLGLPERPMDEESGVLIDSNGNEGESNNWRWAVQRGDGPVWWDIETMRRSTAPNEPSPMTLNAWMERPKVIGIVRARLLDEDSPWPLGVGSWFSPLPSGFWPDLPQVLRDGDVSIGHAGNSGPLVSPRGGIHAKLGRRIDRSVIANSIGSNAIIMVDGDLIGLSLSPLPYDILRNWLKLIHPRLSPLSIEERFSKLVSDIKSNSSNSLTRKVLNDFPGRQWSQQFSGVIDTRSMSERGGEAALLFCIEESELPIVVDWRWKHVKSLDRLASDSRCRLVIGESIDLDLPFKLTSSDQHGKFNLEMQGRLRLPISVAHEAKMPVDWNPPQAPSQIIRGKSSTVRNAEHELEALWLASQLEVGDDVWADKHEIQFPLASWIATTESNHSARWRRIGGQIDPKWAELADLRKFDDSDLADLASVDDTALSILIERIRSNPFAVLSNQITEPSVATAVLLSKEWIEEMPDVVDLWLSQPLRASQVLRNNWNEPGISRLVEACVHHKMLLEEQNLDREEMLAIMEDVHHSLWKEKAKPWLSVCLSSSMGRAALSMLDLPWPAILWEQGLKSDELVLVHHMPDGIGKDSLLDVLEGITAAEQGMNPPIGRCHPYAGWLFQKAVPIVSLETEYNLDVHLELYRRFQQ
jgi:hypothetical protein